MLYDVHYEYVYFKFQAIGLVAIISTRIVQWNGTATPLKSWHLWIWKVVNQTSLHHSVVYHHGHRIPFLGEVTSVVLNYLSFVNFRQEVNEICILCKTASLLPLHNKSMLKLCCCFFINSTPFIIYTATLYYYKRFHHCAICFILF